MQEIFKWASSYRCHSNVNIGYWETLQSWVHDTLTAGACPHQLHEHWGISVTSKHKMMSTVLSCPNFSSLRTVTIHVSIGSMDGMSQTCSFPVCIAQTSVNVISNSSPGYWSSSGVTTQLLSDTNVLCSSKHLTSFCVLVAVQDAAVSWKWSAFLTCQSVNVFSL